MIRKDYSVDIETTGTRPDKTAMIQLAACRFDIVTGEVDPNTFNMCLTIPRTRYWDEDTRNWWMKQPREIITNILGFGKPPKEVLQAFGLWVAADGLKVEHRRFWGKNAGFDFQFYSSYCDEFGEPNQFSFRLARDVKQFLEDRCFPNEPIDVPQPTSSAAHNALVDALLQAKYLHQCYLATAAPAEAK